MLPAGFRQRDQTKKSPTGPFDRFALMDYLEKEAIEHQDRDDLVPFTGEKRGTTTIGLIVLLCDTQTDTCIENKGSILIHFNLLFIVCIIF